MVNCSGLQLEKDELFWTEMKQINCRIYLVFGNTIVNNCYFKCASYMKGNGRVWSFNLKKCNVGTIKNLYLKQILNNLKSARLFFSPEVEGTLAIVMSKLSLTLPLKYRCLAANKGPKYNFSLYFKHITYQRCTILQTVLWNQQTQMGYAWSNWFCRSSQAWTVHITHCASES